MQGPEDSKEEVVHNLVKAMAALAVLKGLLELSSVVNRRDPSRDVG